MGRRLAVVPPPAEQPQPAADAEVVAIVATTEGEWGAELEFRDPAGRARRAVVWAGDLAHRRRCEDALAALQAMGLRVRDAKAARRWLLEAIQEHDSSLRVLATPRLGWHEVDGVRAFVLPAESIGGDVRYAGEPVAIERRGSLSAWQADVARPAELAWPAGLAIMASLSVPLLEPLGEMHPAGIHLWGDSSTGKTTSLRAAASVWGSWRLTRSWRATANGLEAIAETLSDLPLILDEASEVDPRVLDAAIYMLADGQGKSRARRTGDAAQVRRWRTAPISSGERPTAEILEAGMGRQMMGQAARMIDVQVRAEDYGSADAARAVALATDQAYGHAGPAMVEAIMAIDRSELLSMMDDGHQRCVEIARAVCGRELAPVEARALRSMARILLAGRVATASGILPWTDGSALRIIGISIDRWLTTRERPTSETEQICARVRAWIDQHADRLAELTSTTLPRQPVGWCRRRTLDDEQEVIVYLTGDALAAASGGYPAHRVASALHRRGWLIPGRDRMQQSIRVPQGGSRWVYAIRIDEGSA